MGIDFTSLQIDVIVVEHSELQKDSTDKALLILVKSGYVCADKMEFRNLLYLPAVIICHRSQLELSSRGMSKHQQEH